MGRKVLEEDRLAGMLADVQPHLNELQWRLMLGASARSLGRGGITRVAELTGAHPDTIGRGAQELARGIKPDRRVRRSGAGRPRTETVDPFVVPSLRALLELKTPGHAGGPLCWTTKSARSLADSLARNGHVISADTVERLLQEDGYSLQSNVKTMIGKQHPDRDGQFRFINDLVRTFQAAGEPVIGVTAQRTGTSSAAWMNADADAATCQLTVEAIRHWWRDLGQAAYPAAGRLLIAADPGDSADNGLGLWNLELASVGQELGLEVSVSHFPPGARRWSRLEHRLIVQISVSQDGSPLISHQVIIEAVAAGTAPVGLIVPTVLLTGTREIGTHEISTHEISTEISDQPVNGLGHPSGRSDDFHGEWNYTLAPTAQMTDLLL
jgi:Rhodopirellula transposase DDE domain